MKWTEDLSESARRMWRSGMGYAEIARKMGLQRSQVTSHLQKLGEGPATGGRRPGGARAGAGRPRKHADAPTIQLIEAGFNDCQIAEILNIDHTTVYYRRKRLGLRPGNARRWGLKRARWEAAKAGEARA